MYRKGLRCDRMNFLEERIVRDGIVAEGNVLKVDSFLNHQIDVELLDQFADELYKKYKDAGINKILTIEASGIAIASSVARVFKTPLVFAKKSKSVNLSGDVYASTITSFTYKKEYQVMVSKKFIGPEDNVLIVDDFLATGNAMLGLIDICETAGTKISGIGICIAKGYQGGRKEIEDRGYDVTSIAIVESMNAADGSIVFK